MNDPSPETLGLDSVNLDAAEVTHPFEAFSSFLLPPRPPCHSHLQRMPSKYNHAINGLRRGNLDGSTTDGSLVVVLFDSTPKSQNDWKAFACT